MKICIVICLIFVILFGGGFIARNTIGLRHLEDIQTNGIEFLHQNGFDVIGCQGYQTDLWIGSAKVWFTMTKDEYLYECAVVKRDNNFHLYNLKIKNAVNISVNE